jgi:hypothetical protein
MVSGCALTMAALAGTGSAGTAVAQSSTQAAAVPGERGALPGLPAGLVINVLAGGAEGGPALDRWLGGGILAPEETARRATALIEALGSRKGTLPGQDLLKAIDRIAGYVARRLATASVMQLAVDPEFRPPVGSIALKFGPPDAPQAAGFEAVSPKDPRISGRDLRGLRRPLDEPVSASGIAGIEKISLRLAPGDYRVVLLTQNLGDPELVRRPFGRSLRVNGVPVIVAGSDPSRWIPGAVLSNRAAALAEGVRSVGGYPTGRLAPHANTMVGRHQAGGLVIEARAPQGRITIELAEFGRGRSYLTALVAEPANRPSSILLSPEARRTIISQDVRLALEAQVLAAAARLVEQISPADGRQPKPEFESAEVVSSN